MLEFTLTGCDMSHALYYHPGGDELGDQVAVTAPNIPAECFG
jgi:hypothetical protein